MNRVVIPRAFLNIFCKRQIHDSPETGTAMQFIQELGLPCIALCFSFVRVFNGYPEAPQINLYIDDMLMAKNLKYKDFSYYIPIPKGVHSIKVYLSNKPDNPILKLNEIDIPGGEPITLSIWENINNLKLISIVDEIKQKIYPDKSVVRIVNVSPDPLTVHIQPNALYRELSPGYSTEYIITDTDIHSFKFHLANKETFPLGISTSLRAGRIYTLYAVGSLDTNSKMYMNGNSLEIIKSVDGNTIFKQCPVE